MMTFQEALDYLFSPKGSNDWDDRSNYKLALERLGNPHRGMKYIHVAGTNGKGSVCSYLFSVLKEAGYRVGLYTSPHIHRFQERIRVNEQEINEEDAIPLIEMVRGVNDGLLAEGHASLRIFEMITLMAFLYFQKMHCEVVVLEVGLGGRLDATNCILPEDKLVSVITGIGLDHEELLGHSLPEIAAEKAGIIQKHGRVIALKQAPEIMWVFSNRCQQQQAEINFTDPDEIKNIHSDLTGSCFDYRGRKEIRISLLGNYEINNACIALDVCDLLRNECGFKLNDDIIDAGLRKAKWGGRCELLHRDPIVIADGCHNIQGIKAFLESASSLLPGYQFTLIMGVLADKELSEAYPILHRYAQKMILTTPPSARALPAEELLKKIQAAGKTPVSVQSSMTEALFSALSEAQKDTAILVMGSLYQIASVREYFGRKNFYE